MTHSKSYVPGLGIDWLTQYYDPVLAAIFQEHRLRSPVIAAMHVAPGQRVLDIGCGTATLSLLMLERTPAALVAGLDIDPVMLVAAQHKAEASGAAVRLARGSADSLPYADSSFDHVVSSLMMHHLPTAQKQGMLREAWRVLRPGGALLVLDVGPLRAPYLAQMATALFAHFEHAEDNLAGRVPDFLTQAGFVDVQVSDAAFGGLVKLYTGRR